MFRAEALIRLEACRDIQWTDANGETHYVGSVSELNYTTTKAWFNQYVKVEDNDENLLNYIVTSIKPVDDGLEVGLVAPHDSKKVWLYTVSQGKVLFSREVTR